MGCISRSIPPAYKTKNRLAYNEALKSHGLLTTWFDPEKSGNAVPICKLCRQQSYNDAAIQNA